MYQSSSVYEILASWFPQQEAHHDFRFASGFGMRGRRGCLDGRRGGFARGRGVRVCLLVWEGSELFGCGKGEGYSLEEFE